MFLFNPLNYLFEFEFIQYIFAAFGFFGVFLLIRKLVLKKGI